MYCLGEALEQKLSWCPDWKRQISPICHRIAGPYPGNAYYPQHPKICLHVLLTKTKQTKKKYLLQDLFLPIKIKISNIGKSIKLKY